MGKIGKKNILDKKNIKKNNIKGKKKITLLEKSKSSALENHS
jgi:hypothetical protein